MNNITDEQIESYEQLENDNLLCEHIIGAAILDEISRQNKNPEKILGFYKMIFIVYFGS